MCIYASTSVMHCLIVLDSEIFRTILSSSPVLLQWIWAPLQARFSFRAPLYNDPASWIMNWVNHIYVTYVDPHHMCLYGLLKHPYISLVASKFQHIECLQWQIHRLHNWGIFLLQTSDNVMVSLHKLAFCYAPILLHTIYTWLIAVVL